MSERDLLRALQELERRNRENKIARFKPYDEQLAFLNSTANISCLIGGNRVGKSETGSLAVTAHVTGDYPDYWRGVRFAGPIDVWVVGVTSLRVRDTVQEKLFGRLGRLGTGMIPKDKIIENSIMKKTGTPGAFDRVDIKHISGGTSSIQFFSYDQGVEKFMGSSVQLVWFDEEPPEAIFNECRMRILDCGGNMMFSFTPLQGITPLYDNIMQDEAIFKVFLSMHHAKHLKSEDIDRLTEGMSDAEKTARIEGIATVGAGKVFQFAEEEYTIDPFEIPPYWRRLGGFDVGLGHPTGAVMGAIDDDAKVIYITNEYKVNERTAVDIASHLKHWGVKFVTDPSVFSREIATAVQKSRAYTDEGMELIKGNRDREEGIAIIRKLMGSGRLYIFSTCTELLKELRTYRTKTSPDGNTVIVKVNDDVIDAMRYLVMGMEEYAEVANRFKTKVAIKQFRPADTKVGY